MNPPSTYEQSRILKLREFFASQDVSEVALVEQARMDSISGIGRWKLLPGQSGWPAEILDPGNGEI